MPAGEPGDDNGDARPRRPAPFSGANPDAGLHPAPDRRDPPLADGHSGAVEDGLPATSGPFVADLVQAVLTDDRDAVRQALDPAQDAAWARTAAVAAAGALAARLPALSGVDGAVDDDEDEGDLLHAYADLLAERAEPRRANVAPSVLREQLPVVANLAAAAALGDAAGDPDRLVLDGIPAGQQLLAGCVLLAQTCADGGGPVTALPDEIAELFG